MASFTKRGRPRKDVKHEKTMLDYVQRVESTVSEIASQIIRDVVTKAVIQCETKLKHRGGAVSEKLLSSWQKEFPWLEIKGAGNDMRLKCKTCTESSKVGNTWTREGSISIQKDTITKHQNSSDHKIAEKEAENEISSKSSCLEVDMNNFDQEVNSDELKLFRTVFYAACEELPTSKVNSLIELQRINDSDLKYKNLSWDTLSEIQSCIHTILQRALVSDILESEVYAIMLDESTDQTVQKHLSICVRFVKNGEAVTRFLGNLYIKDGKAHTIVGAVLERLEKLGLDPGKVVSLATDGAAVMTGIHTGVGVQLKPKVAPFMIQTHCIAHRLNLAVVDSIKKDKNDNTLVKFRDKFSALFHFMSSSSIRVERLKHLQSLLGEPEITIKEPYSIRWLGLKNAIEAVYLSYVSLLATLSSFAEDYPKAKGLLKYFSDYKTVLLVSFMLDVHGCLGVLSQQLQKQNFIFSEFQPLLDGTLGQLQNLQTNDGKYLISMKQSITKKDGQVFLEDEKLLNYKPTSDEEFRSLRKKYLTKLLKNMKKRFKKADSEMITDLGKVLEPDTVNMYSDKECRDSLEKVGMLYGEDKEVKVTHGDLQEEGLMEETKVWHNI